MTSTGRGEGTRSEAISLSIVVPVYNNAGTLQELASRVSAALVPRAPNYELILVDDGSRDASWTVIRTIAAANPRVRGIRLSRNFGQHPAISAGFSAARGERVVLMDADLEDRPETLPFLIDKLDEGADIVYTTFSTNARQRLTSRLFHAFFSSAVRANVPQNVGTLRAFSRRVCDAALSYREYNVIYGPLMFFMGFDSVVIHVNRDVLAERRSSYNFMRRLRLAQASLISYSNLPNNLFLAIGAAVLGLIGLYVAVIIVQYLFWPSQVPEGLVLLSLLSLAGMAINLLAFGVLGTYVYRVYQETLQRPRYHVRDVVGVSAGEPLDDTVS